MKKSVFKRLYIFYGVVLFFIFICLFVLFGFNGNLSSLMGNSVMQYYCADSSYKLVGDKCEKTIETNYTLLGDIYKDNVVNNKDLRRLENYLNYEDSARTLLLSDEEELAADINEDSFVSEKDFYILKNYLEKVVSTYSSYYDKIGVVKICLYTYKLRGNK